MDRLHPRLADLLRRQGWDALTDVQESAFDPILKGNHALLVAPTGHGKTEAALLPVLSRLLHERDRLEAARKDWPQGFKVLYVTPLRALNRDLLRRLESWAEALDLHIGVRHGDTKAAERARQAKNPPDVLITTPETLQLLLYGDTLRRHLATVRFAVLDEVHDLAQSERGAQLLVALERVEEVIAQSPALRMAKAAERKCPAAPLAKPSGGFQRIGVSATIADPARVAAWLAGPQRTVEVVRVAARKTLRLSVEATQPTPDHAPLAAEFSVPPALVAQLEAVRRIATTHERVLVFSNTRDGAELLASRSGLLDEHQGHPILLGLHHGSLSAEHRTAVEEDFKTGRLRGLVATSSLELGIDVGAIDHVVQVQSPRSVARLVQRLGRAGHRVGAVAEGTLLASGPEDALECMAVARRAAEGRLEALDIRAAPLVVLANQVVALANEYAGLEREWVRGVVRRCGAFADLDDDLFDAVWQALQDVRTLYPDEAQRPGTKKASPKASGRVARSGRARRHFLDHISLIPDETTYRVTDEATKRAVGTVDDAFVAANMAPGALFVMAGRSWEVLEVDAPGQRVRVAAAKDLGAVPQWTGSQLPVSFDVAQEVARLRGLVADGADVTEYPARADAFELARQPIEAQKEAGLAVPTDGRIAIEVNRRSITVHVALGTRGNETLGRITQALWSQRMGSPIGLESDAYRIHLSLPAPRPTTELIEAWKAIEPDSVGLLLAMCLRDSPTLRYHLVHVAKHFGALPKDLDPNVTTRGKLDALMDHLALEEETLARLIHDRMDVVAVRHFVSGLRDGHIEVVVQAQGPLAALGREEAGRLLAPPRTDDSLLAAVRSRIEDADLLMACCNCATAWPAKVGLLPRRIACRRCQSTQVACLRPWNEDKVPLLRRKDLAPDEQAERTRLQRNGALVASFGPVACRALAGRGVGPDTAARILQKVSDPEAPAFWREILHAELTFARTSAFWK